MDNHKSAQKLNKNFFRKITCNINTSEHSYNNAQLLIRIFILIAFTLSSPAYAKIYKWVDEHGRTQFSDKPHISAQEIKIKSTRNKPLTTPTHTTKKQIAPAKHKSILGSNIIKLRRLLNQKKFTELNKEIEYLNKSYKLHTLEEDMLFTAYEAFRIKDKTISSTFDAWITATPDTYQPYIARAIYQYAMGWLSRGGKWASETKQIQLDAMKNYFQKSTEDIITAINLNAPTTVPYYYLIGLTNALDRDDETKRFMEKALTIDPSSFNIRYHYLGTLTPRWGGTAEAMQAYAIETSKSAHLNPKLKALEGYIFTEAGNMQSISRAYNAADALYTQSLEFGELHTTLFERGQNNNRRGDYPQAIADLNRAIELNNEKSLYYYWRATTYIDLKKYKEAMSDIQLAYQLDPYSSDIKAKKKSLARKFEHSAYDSRESQKPESAVEKYNAAIRLNPNDASSYHGRARAYVQQRDLKPALADIKKAIEIDPDNYHHYLFLDYILFKNRDYNQIIKYWKKYLKRHPEDGRAHVEIAGTYHHKKNVVLALKHAKTSAELGNLEGIEAYERFKYKAQ